MVRLQRTLASGMMTTESRQSIYGAHRSGRLQHKQGRSCDVSDRMADEMAQLCTMDVPASLER